MINSFAFRLVVDPQNPTHREVLAARRAAIDANPEFVSGRLLESVSFSVQGQPVTYFRQHFEARRDGIWLKAYSVDRNEWFETLDADEFSDVSPTVEHAVLIDRLAKLIEPWNFDLIRIHGHVPHSESVELGFYQQPNIWAELKFEIGRTERRYDLESGQDLATTLEFYRQILAGELQPDKSTLTMDEMISTIFPTFDLLLMNARTAGKEYQVQELVWMLQDMRLPAECLEETLAERVLF